MAKSKSLSPKLDYNDTPLLSFVIPTYNERTAIGKRVRNFDELDYPSDKFEVIFVDGASTDGTPEIIENLRLNGRSYIHLVREPSRRGYNSAIYEGISQATSNIVVTAEAGSFFDKKAVTNAIRHLNQPSIGVVTGKSVLYNPKESLATQMEESYRNAHDTMRFAESRLDSTPDMKGELLAFRKEIGLRLVPGKTLPENAFFDMSLSYMARAMGFRAIFEPDAVFYEYAPTRMRERITVQIRRGTGFTGALWNFRNMILNPNFGYFGMVIVPSRFFLLIVFPWMLLCAPFIIFWEAVSDPLPALILIALAMGALLFKKSRYLLLTFALSQIVLATASLRLLLKRHTQLIQTVPTARR
jgi:cellulose synthase/poly-beta-1,6-N-acetylglucosamine synthase-like glycosyltransferase